LKKFIYIGIMAILCGSCASQAPLDDAYYWPDKRGNSGETKVESGEKKVDSEKSMEVVSQNDTTITVRIKR
jgi:hypothetical protein